MAAPLWWPELFEVNLVFQTTTERLVAAFLSASLDYLAARNVLKE
jgi:hypothetical protein